jgi:hypothetical protein
MIKEAHTLCDISHISVINEGIQFNVFNGHCNPIGAYTAECGGVITAAITGLNINYAVTNLLFTTGAFNYYFLVNRNIEKENHEQQPKAQVLNLCSSNILPSLPHPFP